MKEPQSEFIRSALSLEETFAGLEQLAQSLERLELDCEPNLERAKKLLLRFSQQSGGLQAALESFSQSLLARRQAVEQAVAMVEARAPLVGEKFREAEEKLARFQELANRVTALTGEAGRLGPAEVLQQLQSLADEAASIQEEARRSKLRTLESNAKNLRATLKELSRKLG
jgi:hypothetical protein